MIDINYKGMLCAFGIALLFAIMIAAMVSTAGCVTYAKTQGKETYQEWMKTPTPTPTPSPTPTPTPTPTPKQTPVSIPTLEQKPVDPYIHGERWENQWFKWNRLNVTGYKDLNVGIVPYRHKWLDKYTWWNGATGNYQIEHPTTGNRFFAVWVHQEMFGTNQTNDPRMYGFDKDAFRLQYNGTLIQPDTTHLPVNRILEFDNYLDYYNVVTAPPLGYMIRYTGNNPETAGMIAEEIGWLRMGQGNSIDGYLLFEVPKKAFDEDVILLGAFSTFGTAYWKFNE
jgi:hypothetical protein